MTIGSEENQFTVDVIELFAPFIGTAQDWGTIEELLKVHAQEKGVQYQHRIKYALDVLDRAYDFYDIKFTHNGVPGYSILKRFSGPPVTFGRPEHRLYRVNVDPQEAKDFAAQNPHLVRLDEQE